MLHDVAHRSLTVVISRKESAASEASAAQVFVSTLHANGIDTMFGLPGSTEAPLMEALRADGSIRYVLTLHENVAVAMADGYARASGRVGFVGLHTSVGTMNGMSQLYGAYRDGVPLVVTAGHKDTAVLSEDGFCALPDLAALPRSFTKLSSQSLSAATIASDVRRAINVAAAPPQGPAYLALPEDLLAGSAPAPTESELRAFTIESTAYRRIARRPSAEGVAAAADLLLRAQRPVLIAGSPAVEDSAAVRELAAALELPVFAVDRTQLFALPYPVRDPRYLGGFDDHPALLEDADCVLALGMRLFFPFSGHSRPNLPPDARVIHAHSDPQQVGWSASPDVGLSGDLSAVIDDLREAVESGGGITSEMRSARARRLTELRAAYERARERERDAADAAAEGAAAVSLAKLSAALGAALPAGALVFDEAVSSSRILLRRTPFSDDARVYRSTGGALGWALPAAVGAKIARPERPVIALVGDGSFHFTPQALWTAVRERAPIVVLVVDNSGYFAVKRAIERHLRVSDDPREHPGTLLPALDHAGVAAGYGAFATVCRDAEAAGTAIGAAFSSERPTVIVVPVPNAR
jgi:benzoylformate decarboxylase